MPPPGGPEIAIAAYYGDAARIRQLLDAGADQLEPVLFSRDVHMSLSQGHRRGCLALHLACFYAHVECVRALVAADVPEQLDWARGGDGATPLLILCSRANQAPTELNPTQNADTPTCVRLLLDAGVALDPITSVVREREGQGYGLGRPDYGGYSALALARRAGHAEVAVLLEDAAALTYAPATHRSFPRPARAHAAALLRVGYRVARGALAPIWAHSVLPFLVDRTSPRAPPPPPNPAAQIAAARASADASIAAAPAALPELLDVIDLSGMSDS